MGSKRRLLVSFEQLLDTYKDPLYCVVLRLTGEHEQAVLLLKKAFVKAYEELTYDEEIVQLKSWLYRLVIAHWREQHVRPKMTVPYNAQLESLIAGLPETERLIFLLRYGGDCSYEDIAEIVELSISQVHNQLHAAKRRMRDEMREMRK